MLNLNVLKMTLGALGFDAAEVTKMIAALAGDVQYMATEVEAQGKMLRTLCKHQGLDFPPEQPRRPMEIDNNG